MVWQRRQEGPPVHGVATEKSEADQALMTGMKSVLGYLRSIRNQVANLPEFKEQEALLELLEPNSRPKLSSYGRASGGFFVAQGFVPPPGGVIYLLGG